MDPIPTRNDYCRYYVSKYIQCLKSNMSIFGTEHGIDMCKHLKDIIEYSECDISNYSKFNNLDEIKNKVSDN